MCAIDRYRAIASACGTKFQILKQYRCMRCGPWGCGKLGLTILASALSYIRFPLPAGLLVLIVIRFAIADLLHRGRTEHLDRVEAGLQFLCQQRRDRATNEHRITGTLCLASSSPWLSDLASAIARPNSAAASSSRSCCAEEQTSKERELRTRVAAAGVFRVCLTP
jgi:hypothetical protein